MQKPAREHAFGEKAEARARAGGFFETDLVADGFAEGLAHFFSHAAGGHACGHATWFEDEQRAELEQSGRDASSFAGAGRCLENEVGRGA